MTVLHSLGAQDIELTCWSENKVFPAKLEGVRLRQFEGNGEYLETVVLLWVYERRGGERGK
jgi:hypothetical protein